MSWQFWEENGRQTIGREWMDERTKIGHFSIEINLLKKYNLFGIYSSI
jgi:hypothetical protein